MIVTCTPNPSIDKTVEVDVLERGTVHRVTSVSVQPGGKGINVARVLHLNGHATQAVAPVGGHEGELLAALVADAEVPFVPVRVDATVRENIAVTEADGTTTKLNDSGPDMRADARDRLLTTTLETAEGSHWIAGCGSLPPGAGDDFYAELVTRARSTGAQVAVDSSGPALGATVDARPDLVKPNHHELAELLDTTITTVGEAVHAARTVVERGVAMVLVSLGSQGALLVTADDVWFGESGPVDVRSTVGAGDSMLAGFLAAGGQGPDALAGGLTWASAAVGLPGSTMPRPADLRPESVRVTTDVDVDRPLKDE